MTSLPTSLDNMTPFYRGYWGGYAPDQLGAVAETYYEGMGEGWQAEFDNGWAIGAEARRLNLAPGQFPA